MVISYYAIRIKLCLMNEKANNSIPKNVSNLTMKNKESLQKTKS